MALWQMPCPRAGWCSGTISTFVPSDEINALVTEHQKSPEQRLAQCRLADEVTALVHGQEATAKARAAAEASHAIDEAPGFGVHVDGRKRVDGREVIVWG